MLHPSNITLTDMFCGCGGSSTGAFNVPGVHVQYAMNHWKLAVDSHNTNHPNTHHDCADISETHPARYQRTTGLIASPECTNHSLAKGQKRKSLNQQEIFQNKAFDPSAVRSRATMWDVPRFAEIHRHEFIIVENVVDVRFWELFEPWLKTMHALGYLHECVYLNAMFAHDLTGRSFAPQSRDRIYIVFWKTGNRKPDLDIRPKAPCPRCEKIVDAVQIWKPGRVAGKYKTQYVYACSECIRKPRNMGGTLSKRGLDVQVVPFYYAALNALDLSLPMTRIGDRQSLGMKPLSENTRKRIQYGLDRFGVKPTILDQRNCSGSEKARIRLADGEPLNTQATGYSSYLFAPYLFNMSFSHAGHKRVYGIDDVLPTQTTQESMGFVSPQPFLFAQSRLHKGQPLTDPLPTQTTLREMTGFVVPIHGTARPRQLVDSMDTVMTTGHSGLMLQPYHGGSMQANSVVEPMTTVAGNDGISLVDTAPRIDDCYFRMLQPSETKRAQGFPTDYVILGNKADQQKQIGNANPPPTMELLVRRCVESLL